MKEKDFDLENGNSDDLYSELSQTLGVSLPQGNRHQSNELHHGSSHRNGAGLTIVTQPQHGGPRHNGGNFHYDDSYFGTEEPQLYEKHDDDHDQHDGHSIRNRRPEQLQQRDLEKDKAERMKKRKKHRKLSGNDDDGRSQCPSVWTAFSRMVTCCFPPPLLVFLGKDV
jgi:hypothetical protein